MCFGVCKFTFTLNPITKLHRLSEHVLKETITKVYLYKGWAFVLNINSKNLKTPTEAHHVETKI